MSEEISRLIDGEIGTEQTELLFESITIGKQNAKSWGTYHLIGHVIRGEVSVTGQDQAMSIAQALEKEPAVSINSAYPVSSLGRYSSSGVISLRGANRSDIQSLGEVAANDYWRPAGMLAMAASIALVAVITFGPSQNLKRDVSDSVAQDVGAGSSTQLVSSTIEQQKFAQEFGEMLSEHGEFTASSGLNGLVAYAKLVSNQRLEQ